jgi:predicted enzyme related to lactoylglutathione lyase
MIAALEVVVVPVGDVDRAVAFYAGDLGSRARDRPMTGGPAVVTHA